MLFKWDLIISFRLVDDTTCSEICSKNLLCKEGGQSSVHIGQIIGGKQNA